VIVSLPLASGVAKTGAVKAEKSKTDAKIVFM
jgi:hypothetical protein